MHDSYTRHECGITAFAASYLLLAFKLYLIWRTFA